MTPAQTAADIIQTIPNVLPCCSGEQPVPLRTIDSLREAVGNAVEEERLLYSILQRCRPVIQQHVVRMQAEADGAAALTGSPNPVSEHWLQEARELLMSVNARIGGDRD